MSTIFSKEKKLRCQRNNLTEQEYDTLVSIKYHGKENFTEFISSLLSDFCKMKSSTIEKMLNHIDKFQTAFKHPSYDDKDNYEYLEIKGDAITKICLHEYITKKFPKLKQSAGVEYISQMKNILEKKESFYSISERLNFFDHIKSDNYIRKYCKSKVLEDVYEAFIGALSEALILTKKKMKYMYYCNNFIQSTFSDYDPHIPTNMIELRGYITILKELVKDKHKGDIKCNWDVSSSDQYGNHKIELHVSIPSLSIIIVERSFSKTKIIGETELSKKILKVLDTKYEIFHSAKEKNYESL